MRKGLKPTLSRSGKQRKRDRKTRNKLLCEDSEKQNELGNAEKAWRGEKWAILRGEIAGRLETGVAQVPVSTGLTSKSVSC